MKKYSKIAFVLAFVFISSIAMSYVMNIHSGKVTFAGNSNSFKMTSVENIDIRRIYDTGNILQDGYSNIKNNVQDPNANLNNQRGTNGTSNNGLNNNNMNNQNNNGNVKIDAGSNQNTNDNLPKEEQMIPESSKTKLLGMKEAGLDEIKRYKQMYRNSPFLGMVAYILHQIAIFSIPVLVIVLIISYVYDSVLGIKSRTLYNKGRIMRVYALNLFVACQVMPLLFALIIKGWGN